jgi:hypothetical protein
MTAQEPVGLSHKGALNAAIMRALARKAYEPMRLTDGPAVPQGREPASVNGQSAAAEGQP